MSVGDDFLDHVRELLSGLGLVEPKRMFGGVGLFAEGTMFALIDDDALYLKADAVTRPLFEQAGSEPFLFGRRDGTTTPSSYWRLPDEAHDDPETALTWGRLAIEASRRKAPSGRSRSVRPQR